MHGRIFCAYYLSVADTRRTQGCPCIYVTNIGDHHNGNIHSVTVYPISAKGNVAPLQFITGRNTGLTYPTDIAVDSFGNIYVADGGGSKNSGSVLVYAAGATGNAAPIQETTGSNTGLQGPTGIGLDPGDGDIYVANGAGPGSQLPFTMTVYSANSNGNVAPIGTISGSNTQLSMPGPLALDTSGNIYAPNGQGHSVTVYAAGAVGNASPVQNIAGSQTQLSFPSGVALDSSLNIYVTNVALSSSIDVFGAGSTGNIAPTRTIQGGNTLLGGPEGIALDGSGNVYVSNVDTNEITVYASGANGDVRPIRHLRGSNTDLRIPRGIAVR